ncbi:ArdC-like ssDNA-binding domain-containing protein [Promicromonospora sp. NPDC023987]|uniref:ArdC-like ssDNA-binding domain-containing protein n=1 Tax=Promicromonospora sp. NPDC023987 TaxID=3155360 RepID=UPI0033D4C49F
MRKDNRTLEQKIADRKAKVDALHEKLTGAVEQLVTGDDWRRAIQFAARFRSRSFNNTLLIWVQHSIAHAEGRVPDPFPSFVAGFKQWHALGRHVDKGQAGYQIFAPVTARMAGRDDDPISWHRLERDEKPAPGEVVRSRMVGVRPTYVWPLSMTSGKDIPLPPAPQLLRGQAPGGLWDGVVEIIQAKGFRVLDAPDAAYLDGANGMTHWIKKTVHVRADMEPAARAKTLLHEAGHVLLHDRENADAVVHRGVAEVEAESVALMVADAHGMDTTDYTIPYVSTWASRVQGQDPVTTVQQTAARVRSAALTILDQLDTQTVTDGALPSIDRAHGLPEHNEQARQASELAAGVADTTAPPGDRVGEPGQRVAVGTRTAPTTDGVAR